MVSLWTLNRLIKIIDEFILNLGITIANCVSLLNPQKVIIGGGVSDAYGSYSAETDGIGGQSYANQNGN
ncbi:MAG: ROK family protein [Treponema sp.]|nr:ROK family protein [Treponema sp.]